MNPYPENSRIYNLFEKLIKINILKRIFIDNNIKYFKKYPHLYKYPHLHKCVILTKEFPQLNEYIDEYLKLYSNTINNKDFGGRTPLILASMYSNYYSSDETVEILLKHNADINFQNNKGQTALMLSCQSSNVKSTVKTVTVLLKYGANVNMQDKKGYTALMFCSSSMNITCTTKSLGLLIQHGADVNIQNKRGRTALILTIQTLTMSKNLDKIKMLIKNKADINIKDINGVSAVDIILSMSVDYLYVMNMILKRRENILMAINNSKMQKINYWRINIIDYKFLCLWLINKFIDIFNFF